MTSKNDMLRDWETDEPIDNALINYRNQVDAVNNQIPNNPAKYLIKCYNRHDDLILTTNSMTSAHEWLDRNNGYFLVELIK